MAELYRTMEAVRLSGIQSANPKNAHYIFMMAVKKLGFAPADEKTREGKGGKPEKFWTMEQIKSVKKLRETSKKKKSPVADYTLVESTQVESTEDNKFDASGGKHEDGKKIIATDRGDKKDIAEQNNHAQNTTSQTIRQCLNNLPAELLSQPRFFALYGKQKKDTPKGWSNPDNQRLFSELDSNCLLGFDTCGHDRATDYLLIDFDHALDDKGEFVSDKAKDWYNTIKSKFGDCYCELSISGHGLHFIGKPTIGKFNAIANGKNGVLIFDKDNDVKIELFYKTKARYCLLTGNCYECDAQAPIPQGAIVDEVFQELLDAIAKQNHVEETPKKERAEKATRNAEPLYTSSDSTEYDSWRVNQMVAKIPVADLSGTEWFSCITALKTLGYSYAEVDRLNQGGKHYDESENRQRWDSAHVWSKDDAIGTLSNLATTYGYDAHEAYYEYCQLHPEFQTKVIRKPKYNEDGELMTTDNRVRTRDKIKSCPVDLTVPDGFLFDYGGITYVVPPKKEGGDPKYICASRTPIVPTKKYREPTKGTVEYEFAILTDGKWSTTEIEGRILADQRAFASVLNNHGALIKDAKLLCSFITDIIAFNHDLPRIKSYDRTGWIDDTFTSFAYPNKGEYIIRRGDLEFDAALATRGNADQWRQKFIEVTHKGGAVASLYIGTALAAVLVKPLCAANPQTHLLGKSGCGKTALQKFTASIYGNPRELIRTFSSTNKNRQLIAAAFCDLPTFLDELETRQGKRAEDELSTDIYNFTDGKGNQANTRNGDARKAFKFSGSRLTTGERPVLKQNDLCGAYKRIIQLDIHGNFFDDEFASDLHFFSESNFGHFGYQWIQFATAHMAEIQAKYRHFIKSDPTTKQYNPTHLKSLAISLVAFEFFKVMLGVTDTFDSVSLIRDRRWLLEKQLPTNAEIDDTARAEESLTSFVASHEKYFIHNQKDTNGDEITFTFASETYGKIFDTGEVAFFPTALKKILEDELKFASADKLIAAWLEQRKLVTNDGRKDHVIKIAKKTYKVIHFRANVISTDTDSAETMHYQELGVMEA